MSHSDTKEEKDNGETIEFVDGLLESISFGAKQSINVAAIGEVSCGKTTFINGLFAQKMGKTARSRTTMSVNIFRATDAGCTTDDIADKLGKYDAKCFAAKKSVEKVKEFSFFVHKMPGFDGGDYGLNIIDVPGFNDRETNGALFTWLHNKAYLLDIVLFIVDINHAFETESITKLLDALLENMARYPSIRMVIIFNKYDEDDEELAEMYESAVKIVKNRTNKVQNKQGKQVEFVHLSAEYAWIYRYYWFNKALTELTKAQQTRFAMRQFGAAGSKWHPHQLQAKLSKALKSYKTCLKYMPGYDEFTAIFNNLLQNSKQLYLDKMRKLLDFIANQTEITTAMMKYVNEISADFSVSINCKEPIEAILSKYLSQTADDELNAFIGKIMPFCHLLKTFCHTPLFKIFEEKSLELMSESVIDWYVALNNDVSVEFGRMIEQILMNWKLWKGGPNLDPTVVRSVSEFKILLDMISVIFDQMNDVQRKEALNYVYRVISSIFERNLIKIPEEAVKTLICAVCPLDWVKSTHPHNARIYWVEGILKSYGKWLQSANMYPTLEILDLITGTLIKVKMERVDAGLMKLIRMNVEGGKWKPYLYWMNLIETGVIPPGQISGMIKYCQWPHLSDVDGYCSQAKTENSTEYANIIAYFQSNE